MTGEIRLRVSGEMPGSFDLGRIEHADLVGVALGEVLDTVGQRPRRVLALEHEDADALLDQLQRAVEEVGGMHRARADPLHLFQDAHAVVIGFRPDRAGAGEDVIVLVLDRRGELGGLLLEGCLGIDQQLRAASAARRRWRRKSSYSPRSARSARTISRVCR